MAYKIMLDAGHFAKQNKSPCNTTPKYYEGDMAWKLQTYLKEELLKYGFVVGTTRTDNSKDLSPVYYRGEKAQGYDMFLSLHSNASPFNDVYEGLDRPVVIYPVKADAKVKSFANTLAKCVYSVMKTKQSYQILTREYDGYPGYDYYGVLRGAVEVGCKNAFIIEHGFHTDTKCTNWLLQDANLQALAVAEAKSIAGYFGVSLPTQTTTPATSAGKTIYKVQVGAYTKRIYADALLTKLKNAGFDGYIVSEKG